MRGALALFGSTSPSYLILQSLDACNRLLSTDYPARLQECCDRLAALRARLNALTAGQGAALPLALDGPAREPMKLTLDAAALARDFTRAVSNELVPRAMRALELTGRKALVAAGGVAANSIIRADLQNACEKAGVKLYLPPLRWCGDNGAMIGAQGYYEYQAGKTAGLELNAYATMDMAAPVF